IASEPESESICNILKAQQPPPSISPSKSSASTLFSHLKPKASRTKSSPSTPMSATSTLPPSASHSISSATATTEANRRPSPPTSRSTTSHSSSPSGVVIDSSVDSNVTNYQGSSNDSNASSKLSISHDCPTMWFGTDDSTIYIYSCFDAVR